MSVPLVHVDLFAFLALELDQPAAEIREQLRRHPASIPSLVHQVEQAEISKIALLLSEPIRHSADGTTLLACNAELKPSYLKGLLTRQMENEKSVIGPISLTLTDEVLTHYRNKVSTCLNALVASVREPRDGSLGMLHSTIARTKELQGVEGYVTDLIDTLLSKGDAIPVLLKAIADRRGKDSFRNGIDSAFVATAVLAVYRKWNDDGERKQVLAAVGMAALLQDVSLSLEPDTDPEAHAERSARVAEELGVSETVTGLILWHHLTKNEKGEPVLSTPGFLSEPGKVLVATNVFLDIVNQEGSGSSFETIKRLNHLAAAKYVDPLAVRVLSHLCLPKVKSYVIDNAAKIAGQCTFPEGGAPILWPVAGDKLPSVFLCQTVGCDSLSPQVSHISHAFPFELEGSLIATIDKGDYHTCSLLTEKLKGLYEAIKGQLKA